MVANRIANPGNWRMKYNGKTWPKPRSDCRSPSQIEKYHKSQSKILTQNGDHQFCVKIRQIEKHNQTYQKTNGLVNICVHIYLPVESCTHITTQIQSLDFRVATVA